MQYEIQLDIDIYQRAVMLLQMNVTVNIQVIVI